MLEKGQQNWRPRRPWPRQAGGGAAMYRRGRRQAGGDGSLTQRRPRRRVSDAASVVAFLLFLSAQATAGEDSGKHPVADIAQTAEEFLRQRQGAGGTALVFTAETLDPRLRLPRCGEALQGFLRPGAAAGNRTVVGVRCSAPRPWKLYVPVTVVEARSVLVAGRALSRGHVLAAEDLTTERRDVSRLAGGYLDDSAAAVGQTLKRRVVAGTPITATLLDAPVAVRRGQAVTLVLREGGLVIRAAGLALSDGALNQRIRVANTSSRREVEGFVRSRELVEIEAP